VPLLGLSFFLGVYPKPVLDRVEPSVRRVICSVERGSDYREPAVAKRGAERANCRELDARELAGR
jgi:NADH-quinone oxidoreductase subunit M